MFRFVKLISVVLVLAFIFSIVTCAPVSAADNSDIASSGSISQLGTITVCGNGGTGNDSAGTDNWLRGAYWDPGETGNDLTEIRNNIYTVSYSSLPAGYNYQFKFLSNHDWYTCNWGEEGWDDGSPVYYHGSGVESDAKFFGANIIFNIEKGDTTAELRLDITNFNTSVLTQYIKNVSCGSKYTVTLYQPDGTPVGGYRGSVSGQYQYIVSGSGAVITKYNGTASDVVIPDTIGGRKVVEIAGGAFANNKKVETVTMPNSVSYIGPLAFANCAALKSVKMSDETVRIASKAFKSCSNLETLDLGDKVQSIEDDAFYGCSKLTILCSPASYAHIFALENNIRFSFEGSYGGKITASVPGNTGGLIVKVTGSEGTVTRSVKDSKAVFAGLKSYDKYTAELYTKSGRLLAKKENIELKGDAYELSFGSSGLYSARVSIIDEKGAAVEGCSVKWFVNGSASAESTDVLINNLKNGDSVKCAVTISDELKRIYSEPAQITKTISSKNEEITIKLAKPETVATKIKVTDASGYPLSGVNVSAVQEITSKLNNVVNLTTDDNGEAVADLRKVNTAVKTVRSGYFDSSKTFVPNGGEVVLAMSSAVGATFIPSVTAAYLDDIPGTMSSDIRVEYSVRNTTTGKAIDNFLLDGGTITIPYDSLSKGNKLEFTAADVDGVLAAAKATVTYDGSSADLGFELKEKGKLSFDYNSNNASCMALVFTNDGKYVTTVDLSSSSKSKNLDSGKYKVVMIGYSSMLYQLQSYSDLAAYGLKSGADFVEKTVTVADGAYTEINGVTIPAFNDSSIFMTDRSKSYVSYSPAEAAPGNYITVSAGYSIQNKYRSGGEVSAVSVSLPEGVQILEGVVLNGSVVTDYTVRDNVLTIPCEDYSGTVKFCILPQQFVSDLITANVKYTYNNKTLVQPIGTAELTLTESFDVPALAAKDTFPVSGTVSKKSTVDVYVDGVLAKSVKANQLGYFTTGVKLQNTFNHTYHDVYFNIKLPSGAEYRSSNFEVEFMIDAVTVSKITISPNGHADQAVVYDSNGSYNPHYFYEPNLSTDLTFTIEFTGDASLISKASVIVTCESGSVAEVSLKRIGSTNRFSGSYNFNSIGAPNNLSIEYSFDEGKKIDTDYFNSIKEKREKQEKEITGALNDFRTGYSKLSQTTRAEIAEMMSDVVSDSDLAEISSNYKALKVEMNRSSKNGQ